MGEFEAVADAVTGGLLGQAVEPATGIRAGRTDEGNCLNCGAALTGPYCGQCGQHALVRRTLSAFGHDFLNGVLNFEGKIFRTLPLLAWRPGELTRRYIEGQRARFVSPLALFLFSVFLLFATIQLIGGPSGMNNLSVGNQSYHSTDEAIAGVSSKIARLQSKRAKAEPDDIKELDRDIADEKQSLATLQKFKREGIANAVLADKDSVNVRSDVPYVNAAIQKAKQNPQLAIYKLQDAASKFAWVLIPISVPFLWLLFPFSRRFRLYDHTVFVTYSLAFIMVFIVVLSLWGASGAPGVALAAIAVPPLHMFRQLKGTYSLGFFGALWRTALLLLFAVLALSLFAMAVVVLGMNG